MKRYKHIFFDLDHTLWDHEKNAEETLFELYDLFELEGNSSFSSEQLSYAFKQINDQLWEDFNRGVVKKSYIKYQRFDLIFDQLRLPLEQRPQNFSREYIARCPYKTNLISGATDILDDLRSKGYPLHIITNGFTDIQDVKLTQSGIKDYFDIVVTSESAKSKKPFRKIFDHALELAETSPSDAIMIGDNLKADIIGARNAQLDQIYFNPEGSVHSEDITYEVRDLIEIASFL